MPHQVTAGIKLMMSTCQSAYDAVHTTLPPQQHDGSRLEGSVIIGGV